MSLPDDKLIKQDNAFTLQHGHLRSITAFTTTPAASVAEACLGPLLASMKCQYDKVIICVYPVCVFIHLSIHLSVHVLLCTLLSTVIIFFLTTEHCQSTFAGVHDHCWS